MNKYFGIDLGTTYSCVAYIDEYDQPVVLKNAEGENTTPSVVLFESPTNVVVGGCAKESASMSPDQVVAFAKNSMGNHDISWNINGQVYTPEAISAEILRKVVKDAVETLRKENKLGQDDTITDVVITCPAYFGIAERDATKAAGKIAGLNVMDIINEPTAAAISYGITAADTNKTVMVYDLGGGTFDITIIKIEPGCIRVVATGGDHHLGGKQWDDKIIELMAQEWCTVSDSSEDILQDPETAAKLREFAERMKKNLSSRDRTPFKVTYGSVTAKSELTRERFDSITEELLESTIMMMQGVLDEAEKKGVTMDDISEVLLVGGSSCMPQVMPRLEAEFPGKDVRMFDPNEAVAKGAAIYAHNMQAMESLIDRIVQSTGMSQEDAEKVVQTAKDGGAVNPALPSGLRAQITQTLSNSTTIVNVTSRSFGIAAQDENDATQIYNLIKKNDELPADVTQQFFTVCDNQSSVLMEVFETLSSEEHIAPSMGKLLGDATLALPAGLNRGTPIEVTFQLDKSGMLSVRGMELSSHRSCEATFDVKGALSEEEVQQAKNRLMNSVSE